jgi:hypothetical protein
MPKSEATVIISNTSIERLEPAIEELKTKGLIFVRTNYRTVKK